MSGKKWCIVKSCCNSFYNSDIPPETTKIFNFPTDKRTRDLWLKILNVSNVLCETKFRDVGVCQRHFNPKDVNDRCFKVSLNKDAIPMNCLDSIVPPAPEDTPVSNKREETVENKTKVADNQQYETASPFGGEFLRYLKTTAKSPVIRQYPVSYFKRLERKKITPVEPPLSLMSEIDELDKLVNTPSPSVTISPDVKSDLFSDIDPKEIEQYKVMFPNLSKEPNFKSHCTSCDFHIGTAPINETIIKMHPILRVTLCKKCYTFYNSGSFEKDEDGTEVYCRWCGQGGVVFCCPNCPYVFCRKCIIRNFSAKTVKDIENNGNWKCFACAPECMITLRADHWALINYIEKQKLQIINHSSNEKIVKKLMGIDTAKCCVIKKPPVLKHKLNDFASIMPQSPSKKIAPGLYKMLEEPSMGNPDSVKTFQKEEETRLFVQCGPDISNKHGNVKQSPLPICYGKKKPVCSDQKNILQTTPFVPITTKPAQLNSTPPPPPPPLIKFSTPTTSVTTTSVPVYQAINSFCIDLNATAQSNTFQLPQNVLQGNSTQSANPGPLIMGQSLIPVYFLSPPPNQSQITSLRPDESSRQLPLPQLQGVQIQQNQIPIGLVDNVNAMTVQTHTINRPILQQQSSTVNQTSIVPTVVSKEHDNSPLGSMHSQFEQRIGNSVEVCQYILGKINNLTNSTSYKTVGSVTDLKDLTLHLSYLLNYAIDRFKTVQENCIGDLKNMELTIKNTDENDDELQIVEMQTTTINLDSDEELDLSGISKNNEDIVSCTKEVGSVGNDSTKYINYVKEHKQKENDVLNNITTIDINVNSGEEKKHSYNSKQQMMVHMVNRLDQIVHNTKGHEDDKATEKAANQDLIRPIETTKAAESEGTLAGTFGRTRNQIVKSEETTKIVKDKGAITGKATSNTIV